jgi:hypothetical protein
MIRTAMLLAAGILWAGTAAAQSNSNPQAQKSAPTQNAQASEAIPAGAPIEASLAKSLDAKKAKPGETVEAHVTENTEQNGKIIIPRGSKLEGHVTQATARSKGDSSSSIEIIFDKVVLKKGGEIPLNVGVQAIALPQSTATANANPDAGMQPMGGGAPASGMGRTGMGSPAAGVSGSMDAPNPPPPSAEATNTSGGPGATGGLSANGRLAPNSRGVFGLPGVGLSTGTTSSQPSAIITSAGKDLHLDGGTQLLLVTRPTTTAQATTP